jgi:L-fuculose-phosphate aldolase
MNDYRELKQAIIDACLRLEGMGYIIGTYGNASARVPEGLIVTPSRVSYGEITTEDMVVVSPDGNILDGNRVPSSETSVHRLIYNARPDIGAILHTHSFYATALSCTHQSVPVIVEEQSQVIGAEISCTHYVPAGQHLALGEEVARALGTSNGVLLANHGAVACGRTVDEAVFAAQIVERVAHMSLLATASGGAILIPHEYVQSERERWLYKYGTAADHA